MNNEFFNRILLPLYINRYILKQLLYQVNLFLLSFYLYNNIYYNVCIHNIHYTYRYILPYKSSVIRIESPELRSLETYWRTTTEAVCMTVFWGQYKRYFIIDQQIVRNFVHFSECSYHLLPFYTTQMINPFLTSRISANHDKGLGV